MVFSLQNLYTLTQQFIFDLQQLAELRLGPNFFKNPQNLIEFVAFEYL